MGQIKDKDYFEDDLSKTDWLGEVLTDVDEDTEKLGRIKVKVFGKFDLLEKEDIPWAYPQNNFTGGSKSGGGFFSVPKKGSIVSVKFDNGNIYMPEYKCHQKISDELKEEIKGSYKNAHSLIYDTETDGGLKVYFTEEKGLIFNYKDSLINILPDNTITLKFKDKRTLHILEDMISLGQETKSAEPGVLGDKNETALKNILAELSGKTTKSTFSTFACCI